MQSKVVELALAKCRFRFKSSQVSGVSAGGDYVKLAVSERAGLIERILDCLRRSVSGSKAELRGSTATGLCDEYSDIDIKWQVPANAFENCLTRAGDILSGIAPVESVRWDPEYRGNPWRRVIFIRFADVPLFWRVDLDIRTEAHEQQRSFEFEQDRQTWSLTESALMNAVAAVKAHLRGQDASAFQLLARAYARVGLPSPKGNVKTQIRLLVDHVAQEDPSAIRLVSRVRSLLQEAFQR